MNDPMVMAMDAVLQPCCAAAFGVRDEKFAVLQICSGQDSSAIGWQPCCLRAGNSDPKRRMLSSSAASSSCHQQFPNGISVPAAAVGVAGDGKAEPYLELIVVERGGSEELGGVPKLAGRLLRGGRHLLRCPHSYHCVLPLPAANAPHTL